MSCATIYDRLDRCAEGEHEPCSLQLCREALEEMSQLIGTIQAQQSQIEGLVLENCGLRSQLDDANRLLEARVG